MSTGFWMAFLFGALLGFLLGFASARGWFKGPRR